MLPSRCRCCIGTTHNQRGLPGTVLPAQLDVLKLFPTLLWRQEMEGGFRSEIGTFSRPLPSVLSDRDSVTPNYSGNLISPVPNVDDERLNLSFLL